jgi:hypothetical protein
MLGLVNKLNMQIPVLVLVSDLLASHNSFDPVKMCTNTVCIRIQLHQIEGLDKVSTTRGEASSISKVHNSILTYHRPYAIFTTHYQQQYSQLCTRMRVSVHAYNLRSCSIQANFMDMCTF